MAFTTMHFAVGMASAGAIASVVTLLIHRGGRWIPLSMTAGGIWACAPDLTRLFKEDFPNAPLAKTLGSKKLENWLYDRGDWFFFHRVLDEQPKEYALHGLALIILLYSIACFFLALRHRAPQQKSKTQRSSNEARDPVC